MKNLLLIVLVGLLSFAAMPVKQAKATAYEPTVETLLSVDVSTLESEQPADGVLFESYELLELREGFGEDLVFEAGFLSGSNKEKESDAEEPPGALGDFMRLYWLELLLAAMAFLKVVTNLTPTKKDNKWFGWLDTLFDTFVPNYKKGGGTFSTKSK